MKQRFSKLAVTFAIGTLVAVSGYLWQVNSASAADTTELTAPEYVEPHTEYGKAEGKADAVAAAAAANALWQMKLDNAISDLEHSIQMAGEVQRAMYRRVTDDSWVARLYSEPFIAESGFDWNQFVSDSARMRYQIISAIWLTETRQAEYLRDQGNLEQTVANLVALREAIVKVYEPNGPYPNLNSFPAAWLAALPNGDPRNLPFRATQGVGPHSFALSESRPSSSVTTVSPRHLQHACRGPQFTSGGTGGFSEGDLQPRQFFDGACGDYFRSDGIPIELPGSRYSSPVGLNHVDSRPDRLSPRTAPSTSFITHTLRAFSLNGIQITDRPVNWCWQVNSVPDSKWTQNGFDFERDINGFVVFRQQDWCRELSPESLLPNGGVGQGSWEIGIFGMPPAQHQGAYVMHNIVSCDAVGMAAALAAAGNTSTNRQQLLIKKQLKDKTYGN